MNPMYEIMPDAFVGEMYEIFEIFFALWLILNMMDFRSVVHAPAWNL